MPTYNREYEIKIAINSVINQSYKNWELIIVDNYSDDKTEELIKSFNNKKIFYYKIKNNGIIAKSRNYGIRKSKGKIISFLDSDDWWKFNKLELAMQYINNGYEFTYHRKYVVKSRHTNYNFIKTFAYSSSGSMFYNLLQKGNCIPNSSVTLHKYLLENINGFDESPEVAGSEDFDGWLRISKISNNFVNIPKTLGYYWTGGDCYSSDDKMLRNLDYIEKKHQLKLLEPNNYASFDYTRARIFQNKKNFKQSKFFFKKIFFKRSSIRILIQSLLMIFYLNLIIIYKSRNNK